MFGLTALFAAMKRLTTSINQTADLWDQANEQLRQQLAVEVEMEGQATPLLEHQLNANGKVRPAKARK